MAEKFCLKWNDFNSNVSKSFGLFRNEAYLHDVTLVSDDHKTVSAHKLVLSACSEYFRDIFKNNSHSHPLLCLDGISTEDLRNIMEYMYNGEVNIFQDKLDRFLGVAQRFKLEGLIGGDSNDNSNIDHASDVPIKNVEADEVEEASVKIEPKEETSASSQSHLNSSLDPSKNVLRKKKRSQSTRDEIVPAEAHDMDEIDEKINLYLEECSDGSFRCAYCNKGSNPNYGKSLQKQIIQKHIETHLGLTYTCPICQKITRSRNSLAVHKSTYHKS